MILVKNFLCIGLIAAGASLRAMRHETKTAPAVRQGIVASKRALHFSASAGSVFWQHGKRTKNLPLKKPQRVTQCVWSSDQNYILVARKNPCTLQIIDRVTGEALHTLNMENVHITEILQINFVEKTNTLVVVGYHGERPVVIVDRIKQPGIMYWKMAGDHAIDQKIFDKDSVLEIQVSGDHKRCLVRDTQGTKLCVFEPSGIGYILKNYIPEQLLQKGIASCDFWSYGADDKQTLIVTYRDGSRTVVDYTNGEMVRVHYEVASESSVVPQQYDKEGHDELMRVVTEFTRIGCRRS